MISSDEITSISAKGTKGLGHEPHLRSAFNWACSAETVIALLRFSERSSKRCRNSLPARSHQRVGCVGIDGAIGELNRSGGEKFVKHNGP